MIVSVDVVLTTNDSLSGTATRDGVILAAGVTRALSVAQTMPSQNGPWLVQSGTWTRPFDFDADSDFVVGQWLFVQSGTLGAGSSWQLTSGSTLAGAKTYTGPEHLGSGKSPWRINVKDAPWFLKGDGSDETDSIAALFAYLATLAGQGIGTIVGFPAGTYGTTKTIDWPRLCTIEGAGNASTIVRLLDVFQDPCHTIRVQGVLNQGISMSTNCRDIRFQNDTCTWTFGGDAAWAPKTKYAQPDSDPTHHLYIHTRDPSNVMLKLVTPGISGEHVPMGQLYPVNPSAKLVGTSNANSFPVFRVTAPGFFGPGGMTYQVAADGGTTWGPTQTTTSQDFVTYVIPGLGGTYGVKIPNKNWSVNATYTTSNSYTQPSVGATVTVGMVSTAGLTQFQFVNIADGGLYEISAPVSEGATQLTLTNMGASGNVASGAAVGTGKQVQSVYAPDPRVEVIGAPPADNYLVDVMLTGGPLGVMQFYPAMGVNPEKWKYGLTLTSPPGPFNTTAGASYDYPISGTSLTLRFHAGVYRNNEDYHYLTPSFGWSMETGTQITDGTCVWEIVEAPACIRLNGAGSLSFDSVSTEQGNVGYAMSQCEVVEIGGQWWCNGTSMAGIWISNGDMRFGEGGGLANVIRIGGAGSLYGTGFGIIDDGGMDHTVDGTLNFELCEAGWLFMSGVYGGLIQGYYVETTGGKFRNSCYCSRNGDVQGIYALELGGGYGGSITAGDYMLDCYAAVFNAHGILAGGAAAGFRGIASCYANISGRHLEGLPLVDAPPQIGTVSDFHNGRTILVGKQANPSIEKRFASGPNDNVGWSRADIVIVGPTAAFSTTGFTAGMHGDKLNFRCFVQQQWTIPYNSAASLAGARIHTPSGSDVVIPAAPSGGYTYANFEYVDFGTGGAWYLIDHSPTAQSGSTTLSAGVSPAIAATIKANSFIGITLQIPSGIALTTAYAALGSDRAIGAPGSFKISALTAGGTVNTADGSTLDWTVSNP